MEAVVLTLWNESAWPTAAYRSSLPSKVSGSSLSLVHEPTLWLLLIGPVGPRPGKSVLAKCQSGLRDSHFLPPGQLNREDYSLYGRRGDKHPREVERRGQEGGDLGVLSVPHVESLHDIQLPPSLQSSWYAPIIKSINPPV